MEIRHLQALVGMADHGSFSAAAEALGTVQSNVSAHVARLERELGAPLVDRSAGRLTEEGEIVVARARRMLVEMVALVADVSAMRHEVVGDRAGRDDRDDRAGGWCPVSSPCCASAIPGSR